MPESINSAEMLKIAVEKYRVAAVPGHAFYPDGSGKNTMRLNFSCAQPEMIEEGIRRLGVVLKEQLAHQPHTEPVAMPVLA